MQIAGWSRNVFIKHVFLRKSFIPLLFVVAATLHMLIAIRFSGKLVSRPCLPTNFFCQSRASVVGGKTFSFTYFYSWTVVTAGFLLQLFKHCYLHPSFHSDVITYGFYSCSETSVLSDPSTPRYPLPNENTLLPKIKHAYHYGSIV